MGEIAVVGSINMDMVMYANKLPEKGETVNGTNFILNPGGKGANQAVAAARMGADVHFVGKVGNDVFGTKLLNVLEQYGVSVEHVMVEEGINTGTASITVHSGDNSIILSSGANARVTVDYVESKIEFLRKMDVVVLQNEIPLETTKFICHELEDTDVKILFDPAPYEGINPVDFSGIDFFTPNESECKALTGYEVSDINSACNAATYLTSLGIKHPIITMGEKGVIYASENKVNFEEAYRIESKDSIAAGDTFSGAFAARIAEGISIREAVTFANAAAAIATTRLGAQQSIPTYKEVVEWIASRN